MEIMKLTSNRFHQYNDPSFPPQEWTWLSDDEVLDLFCVRGPAYSDIDAKICISSYKAIEAKLKEKNNG